MFHLAPQIKGFDLIGAQITLTVDGNGSPNWSKLIKAKSSGASGYADASDLSAASEPAAKIPNSDSANAIDGDVAALAFLIQSINLNNL